MRASIDEILEIPQIKEISEQIIRDNPALYGGITATRQKSNESIEEMSVIKDQFTFIGDIVKTE